MVQCSQFGIDVNCCSPQLFVFRLYEEGQASLSREFPSVALRNAGNFYIQTFPL